MVLKWGWTYCSRPLFRVGPPTARLSDLIFSWNFTLIFWWDGELKIEFWGVWWRRRYRKALGQKSIVFYFIVFFCVDYAFFFWKKIIIYIKESETKAWAKIKPANFKMLPFRQIFVIFLLNFQCLFFSDLESLRAKMKVIGQKYLNTQSKTESTVCKL